MLKLLPKEEQLCDLLQKVTLYLQNSKQITSPTLRIAGGWVRDKILGLESHDIDVAIDNMMGFEFASHVHDYVYQIEKQPSLLGHGGNITRIKSNPEKSKHLETATLQLFGMEIDFVNLRNEIYQPGSRIPQIIFGSPKEDALRRDLTINALFFNIHSRQVEDFLGCGLSDLKEGLIRTPMNPLVTFKDDPLRILRAIRFASRFGYQIVPEIQQAIEDPQIKHCLSTVISKERVGEEVKKMMTGNRPLLALEYMIHFGIYQDVFRMPEQLLVKKSTVKPEQGLLLMKTLDWSLNKKSFLFPLSKQDLFLLNMACCVFPCRDGRYLNKIGKKKVDTSVILYITKESLKFPSLDSECIEQLNLNYKLVQQMTKKYQTFQLDSAQPEIIKESRLEIGKFIYELGQGPLKAKYQLLIYYAALEELSKHFRENCPPAHQQQITSLSANELSHPKHVTYNEEVAQSVIKKYSHFLQLIQQLQLQKVHELKPLVNGHQLIQWLQELYPQHSIKAGKWLSLLQQQVLYWQLKEGMRHLQPEEFKSQLLNAKEEEEWMKVFKDQHFNK